MQWYTRLCTHASPPQIKTSPLADVIHTKSLLAISVPCPFNYAKTTPHHIPLINAMYMCIAAWITTNFKIGTMLKFLMMG